MSTETLQARQHAIERGSRLEHFTIAWNTFEALVAVIAGIIAGSIALEGFGLDSVIEVLSALALLWRLQQDNHQRREEIERLSLRIVGACFLALAAYVLVTAIYSLIEHQAPETSAPGIVIAALAIVVMPLLGRAKRKVAREIGSAAMNADSKQADFCAYLSGIVLAGLLLNAVGGWWWADSIAALVMVPIVGLEAINGLRGKPCDCHGACG